MPKHAPSVYVPLDANYMRDPRIRRAGPEAELLYVRSLAYSKSGETDGIVHDYDLELIAVGLNRVQNRVAALVREKAWEPREGGWFITGWFNWNESTAKLRDRKERRVVGAARTNHAKHQERGTSYLPNCPICAGEIDAA